MPIQLINQYYSKLDCIIQYGGSPNETSIRGAFHDLLNQYADKRNLLVVEECWVKGTTGNNIKPDGVLKNTLRLDYGYWESNDQSSNINDEIDKKIRKGYPLTNTLFENSLQAILFQHGHEVMRVDMKNPKELNQLLLAFTQYEHPQVQEFSLTLEKYKASLPSVIEDLRERINVESKRNHKFVQAFTRCLENCREEVSSNLVVNDVREMLIQHILTREIFDTVFEESHFYHENNVAFELEKVIDTFFTGAGRHTTLKELHPYYQMVGDATRSMIGCHEKKKFLKAICENFYEVYNPKGADWMGGVETPSEVVYFMIEGTDYLLHRHFGKTIADKNVEILDPATGSGTFVCDLIDYMPEQYLEYKYKNEMHANEVALLPYYMANLTIELTFRQKMACHVVFDNMCFVDTLENTGTLAYAGKQQSLFASGTENAARIRRQNEKKISIIIGNPLFHASQNRNRTYAIVDKRIKETFLKRSSVQKTKVYDMYTRFYRWAMDRLDQSGIIAFVTTRGFIDKPAFDGFRKIVEEDFDNVYILDMRGEAKPNTKMAKAKHDIFNIQTGIAIMFLIRCKNTSIDNRQELASSPKNHDHSKPRCNIYYASLQDEWRKEQKLKWLKENKIQDIAFESIIPNQKYQWINIAETDPEKVIPLIDKDVKEGKSEKAIFKLFTSGIRSQRDEWVYDHEKENLVKKMQYMIRAYTEALANKENKSKFSIQWDRELKNYLEKGVEKEFDENAVIKGVFKPFFKMWFYFDEHFNGMTYEWFNIYNSHQENKLICIPGVASPKDFYTIAINSIIDQKALPAAGQCLPLYGYDDKGNRTDNITDWCLERFHQHYVSHEKISQGFTLPKDLQQVLAQLERESAELPILKRHFNPIKEALVNFSGTFTVETFAPVQRAIGRFQQEVIQRRQEAVERKSLYQRIANYLSTLQAQLQSILQQHRRAEDITKQDIFHYAYGVLHSPAYRKKCKYDLKYVSPHLPFYPDFWQWADWGKQLMELHIGYEDVEVYPLERVEEPDEPKAKQEATLKADVSKAHLPDKKNKLKVKLTVDTHHGIIELDEKTSLHGVPAEAWKYRVGNRTALKWVLDQYKEKKPKDPIIRKKFNTCRFADHKEEALTLLQKVCAISVDTMKIIQAMDKREEGKLKPDIH